MHVYSSTICNCKIMEPTQMPINQQVDKDAVVYIYDGLLTAMERNELMAFSETWMRLETIILNEVTQEWKTKHCMFSLICVLIDMWELSYKDAKALERSDAQVPRTWAPGGREVRWKGKDMRG